MKSKIIETAGTIPVVKKIVPKTDSIRLEVIETHLKWLLVVGGIGFSLTVWGYNDLKSEMKDLRIEMKSEMKELRAEMKSEMKDLRAEMNSKFEQVDRKIEKQTAMLLKAIKHR